MLFPLDLCDGEDHDSLKTYKVITYNTVDADVQLSTYIRRFKHGVSFLYRLTLETRHQLGAA
jgi:hypothetical protein